LSLKGAQEGFAVYELRCTILDFVELLAIGHSKQTIDY
jgi:hypothetical protein